MNHAALPKLHIVILAAGFSSRLGHSKALARVHGTSLLRRTLTLAGRFAASTIIVPRASERYRFEARGLEAAFAVNSRRAAGLSSSVRRGIAKAPHSAAILLMPVDLAMLEPRDIGRLIARWRAARRCVVARRVERDGAAFGGVPLILPRWLYTRALSVRGDIGLRDLVAELDRRQRLLVHLPSAALDVDTAQDLRTARRRWRAPCRH